jgi:hypothetical protein
MRPVSACQRCHCLAAAAAARVLTAKLCVLPAVLMHMVRGHPNVLPLEGLLTTPEAGVLALVLPEMEQSLQQVRARTTQGACNQGLPYSAACPPALCSTWSACSGHVGACCWAWKKAPGRRRRQTPCCWGAMPAPCWASPGMWRRA